MSEDSVRTTLGVQKLDSSFVCTGSKTLSDMNEVSLSGNSVNIYQHIEVASFPHLHGRPVVDSLYSEDGGRKLLLNVSNFLECDTPSCPIKLWSLNP